MVTEFILEMQFLLLVGALFFMGCKKMQPVRKKVATPKHNPGQSLERTLPGIPGNVLSSGPPNSARHDYKPKGINIIQKLNSMKLH